MHSSYGGSLVQFDHIGIISLLEQQHSKMTRGLKCCQSKILLVLSTTAITITGNYAEFIC